MSDREMGFHGWIPNSCQIKGMEGHIDFNGSIGLYVKDGYVYDKGEAIAEIITSRRPNIPPEAVPRTGGAATFKDLRTGEVCTYDTTK